MASGRRRSGEMRLDQPIESTRGIRPAYDSERFGRLSERVARYIGSWAFIAWMSLVILAWLSFNIFAPEQIRPDTYPFIFLTLLLSLQASYAAPLILLAQNRQTDRDRVQYQEDRARNERMLADSDYLAREVASLRSSLGDMATRDFVRSELRET
jgi:Predicted membrane protein